MNPHTRFPLVVAAVAVSLLTGRVFAEPIDYNEVSLLVRAHESEPSITQEVTRRKLVHALTPQQEQTLKAQGASDSLVQTLRRSDLALPATDLTAYETHREQIRQAQKSRAAMNEENAGEQDSANVHVFNVAYGQPLNLSQWGGLDYEIAFYSYRFAGEDYIEPVMIDNVRTVTEVTRPIRFTSENEAFSRDFFPTNTVRNWRYMPYDARFDERDNRLNQNDTVSVRSNSASRRLMIDWQNPVYIHGQPYAFYPVYGAGDASLYYIGKANDRTARVAVISRR
ncbi:MAG: hypothetical protein ACXV9Q_00150 [Chthoniobacterales bacterium]